MTSLLSDLLQFTGTEHWYKHNNLTNSIIYTDGVEYLAEKASAYWLIDLIASYQNSKFVRQNTFQVWKLNLHLQDKNQATVTCDDGNGNILVTQVLEYTDFPEDFIKLYLVDNVLMLPGEY